MAEAGIDCGNVFVTNAVKHFNLEHRGKRRLHKKPNANEIEHCRWWNELERPLSILNSSWRSAPRPRAACSEGL
jgi:uracil-DNA glycosylase